MSDNVQANPGADGAIFATDEIDGKHYPISKLGFGALDALTLVSSTNGFPVEIVLGLGSLATAAKQPALGTAGTPATDVITVQGIASMTALKVDGSAVTQPVSNAGTFAVQAAQSGTWNIGTVTSLTTLGTITNPVGIKGADGSAIASNSNPVPISDAGGSLTVDGSVSVSGLVPGTSATSLGKAEDAVAADGDTGVMMLAVRKDTAATTVGADGDYHPLEVDANGNLWTMAKQSGTWAVGLSAGTNSIGKLAANSGVDIGDVDVTSVPTDPFGANADAASATGSISAKLRFIAATGIPITGTVTVGSHAVTNAGTFAVQATPATSGGLSQSKTISVGSTNATSVKASAGQLFEMFVSNINASPRYLKLYDKASAPTVGSDTPVRTMLIPGNAAGGGFSKEIVHGLAFSTGIAFALTTGVADNDTGAVGANDIVVNLGYK